MKRILFALGVVALFSLPGSAWAQATNGPAINTVNGGQNILKILQMLSGQIMVGQGANTDPINVSLSGDCTLSAAGAITCTKTNGGNLGTAATVNTGTAGATIPLNNSANVFSALNTFTGHVAAGSSAPTLSSCGGGSPAILGDDKDGQVTMGTTATGCVITFASAYTGTPLCVVTWQATPLASQSYAITNTAITLTQTSTSSNKVNYHCTAQNGG